VPLVVRTWNLFHGNADPPERRAFLREMVELVTADGPDVVCRQEVPLWAFTELERWSGMQAVTAVARPPRLRSARLGRLVTGVHHGLLRSALTGEGAAILAARRLGVESPRTVVVGEHPLRRIALSARVEGVLVVDFHVNASAAELARVAAVADGAPRAILAGDANLPPPYDLAGWSEPLAASIDQILVRGLEPLSPPEAWPRERRTVGDRVLSDHAPVELRLG
jgi:endonuclease/exonuclease/phosphatase family metal-dependent hydrolase